MRIGGRVTVRVTDGPYRGAWVRVDRLTSDVVLSLVRSRFDAFDGAGDAAVVPLLALYRTFVEEARPQWVLEDPRGPLAVEPEAMLRLPMKLGLRLVELWIATFPEETPDGG